MQGQKLSSQLLPITQIMSNVELVGTGGVAVSKPPERPAPALANSSALSVQDICACATNLSTMSKMHVCSISTNSTSVAPACGFAGSASDTRRDE
jgi:hypothetical protein